MISLKGITFVFTRLTILAEEERPRLDALVILRQEKSAMGPPTLNMRLNSLQATLRQQGGDWKEFYNSPVFPSSLAIALLYLMVLSFDGPMLSYLKSHNYSDPFLAAMRGVGVVTGLIGTVRLVHSQEFGFATHSLIRIFTLFRL